SALERRDGAGGTASRRSRKLPCSAVSWKLQLPLAPGSVDPSNATVPRQRVGDLDIAGPAWLRSYPDRGGPVHQKRRNKLMRRASTCLAVLGLIALAAPALAAAEEIPTPTITKFIAKAVPVP